MCDRWRGYNSCDFARFGRQNGTEFLEPLIHDTKECCFENGKLHSKGANKCTNDIFLSSSVYSQLIGA
jgi:hypothetical protein